MDATDEHKERSPDGASRYRVTGAHVGAVFARHVVLLCGHVMSDDQMDHFDRVIRARALVAHLDTLEKLVHDPVITALFRQQDLFSIEDVLDACPSLTMLIDDYARSTSMAASTLENRT